MKRRTNQKFQQNDLVQLASMIPWIWEWGESGPKCVVYHDYSGMKGVVVGSYSDQYGGNDRKSYTVAFKNKGSISWVDEKDMTLIEDGRADLFEKWNR